MLSKKQLFLKRTFDILISCIGIVFLLIPIVLLVIMASISTKSFGIFVQERVGQHGKYFLIYKIRTMKHNGIVDGISIKNDSRITGFGSILRKYNLDELPQLFNVLKGDMSLVGPRPDVKGYADLLTGEDRIILSVKPGITGPATLKYRNEEEILINKVDPKRYNDEVIWKDKIRINKMYVKNWIFFKDLKYIYHTIFS